MPKKAKPLKLEQAYLILSNKKERFEDRLDLVDLFIPDTFLRFPEEIRGKEEYKAKLSRKLWETLMDAGFRVNHRLEWQYQKQQTCLWCGGQVMTHGNEDSWETVCSNCGYLYDED